MKKQSTVINLCERYPERFERTDIYELNQSKNNSTLEKNKDLEILDEAIKETTINLFCLVFRKLNIF